MKLWRAALLAAAAGLALAPIPSALVERFYARGVYPPLQRALTAFSNLTPLALLDILLLVGGGWWIWTLVGDMRGLGAGHLWRAGGRVLRRTLTAAALTYVVFVAVWGLNYRRVPLTERLVFDPDLVSAEAARTLASVAADEVNALHGAAHATKWAEEPLEASLAPAFAQALRLVGVSGPVQGSRAKRTMLDPYFRAAAVEGMTNPFFLETLIASGLLPFERPFVMAHEWSHLAGFADEGEANFLGWLACVNGSDALRYSGWLFLYRELAGSLPSDLRAEVTARLRPGPRSDLQAIAERVRREANPAVSRAGWRVYDRYLKANRVEAGAASYAEVVRIVLGTCFRSDWTPRLKGQP